MLWTLSLHMNQAGANAYPSQELVASESGLGLRTVKEHVAAALAAGWLGKRERRLKNSQGWRRNEYFACIPPAVEALLHVNQRGAPAAPSSTEEAGAPAAPRSGEGGAPDSKNMVRLTAEHGAPAAHEYFSNSSGTHRPAGRAVRGIPLWKLTDDELIARAKALGISTIGESRNNLLRSIEAKGTAAA